MENTDYYNRLGVNQKASLTEIKQAYRLLAKRFHPDSQTNQADHETIILINAAYEVLRDPQKRRYYDQQLSSGFSRTNNSKREERTSQAQNQYQNSRKNQQQEDVHKEKWLKRVYTPIDRLLSLIIKPLNIQIEYLSADPFDDELMGEFLNYLCECRNYLNKARSLFASQPNPPKLATVAASLYYCLNHINDGIEELERFTLNYDDYYLRTGKELFRMTQKLRREAQELKKAESLR